MQINRDTNSSSYGIISYAAGEITVLIPRRFEAVAPPPAEEDGGEEEGGTPPIMRRETLRNSLIIMPELLLPDWPPQSWENLSAEHFDLMAQYQPELVLFGSGARLRHPSPRLYAGLIRRGIGVEVMDTGSACRTYNFLMTDRRRVLAALLMI